MVDGAMGETTLAVFNGLPEAAFCKAYLRASQLFYVHLCQARPDQLTFLSGWVTRTHKAEDAISAL